MPDTQTTTTTTTVTIETEIFSVTVSDDGTADTLTKRTITDTATNEIIVRDVVRTTEKLLVAQPILDSLIARQKARGVTDGK